MLIKDDVCGAEMDKQIVHNIILDLYKQFSSESSQIYVVMQRLYALLAEYFFKDEITDYHDQNGHIKEFETIMAMLNRLHCDNRKISSFTGLWKTANIVKHGTGKSFEENYVRLCISHYNSKA